MPRNIIPQPKKHHIEHYLFFVSVLFENGNSLALFIDAETQKDAEQKLSENLKTLTSANVASTFVCPVQEIIK